MGVFVPPATQGVDSHTGNSCGSPYHSSGAVYRDYPSDGSQNNTADTDLQYLRSCYFSTRYCLISLVFGYYVFGP